MSTIITNEELTKAIQDSLNPADIRAAVQTELAKQEAAAATTAQTVSDQAAAKAAADAAAGAETVFTRTEVIGGKEFTFEAASELELERTVNNAFKVAYAMQTPEARVAEPVVDPAVAAQAAADEAAAKVELELKFKRGDISTADYLEQSGELERYLASKGAPLASLKAVIEQNENTHVEQSWVEATEAFRNGPAGSDWPGGERNLKLIGREIAALGLIDATDKVAALAQAYESMKAAHIVFPYEPPADAAAATTVAATTTAAATTTVAATTTAAAPVRAAASSSLFGQSSGVSGGAAPAAAPAKSEAEKAAATIAADASPAEIMAAWKASQVAAGKHPDDALREQYNRSRA